MLDKLTSFVFENFKIYFISILKSKLQKYSENKLGIYPNFLHKHVIQVTAWNLNYYPDKYSLRLLGKVPADSLIPCFSQ